MNIKNYQRRALERVRDQDFQPFRLKRRQTYLLNGEVIYLAGISDGVGTCADFHGIDIAVFTMHPVSARVAENILSTLPRYCQGTALARGKKSDESNPNIDPNVHTFAAEGLSIVKQDFGACQIYFKSNGKIEIYPELINPQAINL